jgi:hypothetical protein
MKSVNSAVTLENGRYIVSFSEIFTVTGSKFFVDLNGESKSGSFEMIASNGRWRIVPPVPGWILAMETQLVTILNRDLQMSSPLETNLHETHE